MATVASTLTSASVSKVAATAAAAVTTVAAAAASSHSSARRRSKATGRKSKSTVSATPIRGSTLPVQHDQSDMDDYDHSVGDANTTKGAFSDAKKENRRGRTKKPALISTESANEDADEKTLQLWLSQNSLTFIYRQEIAILLFTYMNPIMVLVLEYGGV
ncbi:hypothetical protein BSLG_010534 [Batrachochytrium salamandrivorans]|nr:hypothetical protein BSLG_010534 [Batrachochytrium salamandrivorans]